MISTIHYPDFMYWVTFFFFWVGVVPLLALLCWAEVAYIGQRESAAPEPSASPYAFPLSYTYQQKVPPVIFSGRKFHDILHAFIHEVDDAAQIYRFLFFYILKWPGQHPLMSHYNTHQSDYTQIQSSRNFLQYSVWKNCKCQRDRVPVL